MNQQNQQPFKVQIAGWVCPVVFIIGLVCIAMPSAFWFVLAILFCMGGAFLASTLYRSFESCFDSNTEWHDRLAWALLPGRKLGSLPFWALGVALAGLFLAVGFFWNL